MIITVYQFYNNFCALVGQINDLIRWIILSGGICQSVSLALDDWFLGNLTIPLWLQLSHSLWRIIKWARNSFVEDLMNSLKHIFLEEQQFLFLLRTVPFKTFSKLYLAQRKGLWRSCSTSQFSSATKNKLQATFYRSPGYDIFIILIAASSWTYRNNCRFHKHPIFRK